MIVFLHKTVRSLRARKRRYVCSEGFDDDAAAAACVAMGRGSAELDGTPSRFPMFCPYQSESTVALMNLQFERESTLIDTVETDLWKRSYEVEKKAPKFIRSL